MISVLQKGHEVGVPNNSVHLFPVSGVRIVNASSRLGAFTRRVSRITIVSSKIFRGDRVALGRLLVSASSTFLNGALHRSNVHSGCRYLVTNIRQKKRTLVAPSIGIPFRRKSMI